MSNTAQININVTQFNWNSAGLPCEPYCIIDPPTIANGPGSSGPQDASGQVGIDPVTHAIWVNRKNAAASPVTLVFTIGPGTAYSVIDPYLTFRQSKGTGDTFGSNNFKNISPSGNIVSVEDHWWSHGPKKNGHTGAPCLEVLYQDPGSIGQGGVDRSGHRECG